jgi:MacB-like periplasmic core domain
VGQKVRVNDRELTVIGVAPKQFQGTMFPLKFDLWVPATLTPTLLGGARDLEDRTSRGFSLIGMLRPGATRVEAQAELTTAMAQLARDYPEANAGTGGEILSFWEAPRGPQRLLISGLAILQGVMLLLLLREHGKPHAGSWKHPAARNGRACSAGRGTLAHCQPGALGKYAARFPGSRPRSSFRRLGYHGIAHGAIDWHISHPVSVRRG